MPALKGYQGVTTQSRWEKYEPSSGPITVPNTLPLPKVGSNEEHPDETVKDPSESASKDGKPPVKKPLLASTIHVPSHYEAEKKEKQLNKTM